MVTLTRTYNEEIDRYLKAIYFFINCHQWSGLQKPVVNNWLSNFSGDIMSKYFSVKLLSQMLYYSENDLYHMLRRGTIHMILEKEILINKQLRSGFTINQQELQNDIRRAINETLFVPLLDQDAPFESGNQISRILTQRMNIPTSQVKFAFNISNIPNTNIKRLIIVDDCIGSGQQCKDFWENTMISDGSLLRDWCNANNIEAHYIVLVGYENNINTLSAVFNDLKICCVEKLQDEHRVFSENSFYWNDKAEKDEAEDFFSKVCSDYGLNMNGYNNMDFAVVMHLNIPDWSLPLFWKSAPDWKILMRRKNS